MTLAPTAPGAVPSPVSLSIGQIASLPNPYPDVVATVNGAPVHGAALARNVEIDREEGLIGLDSKDVVTYALQGLIKDQLLVQEAKRRGLWPSTEEAAAAAKDYKDSLLKMPQTLPQVKAELAAQGLDFDTLDSDPRSLDFFSETQALAKIKTEVRNSISGDPRTAIDTFAEQLWSDADIQIYITQ